MITAHTAAAGTAEGKVGTCKLKQGIINAATAKGNILKDPVNIPAAV